MAELKQPDVYITSPSPELLIVSALGSVDWPDRWWLLEGGS